MDIPGGGGDHSTESRRSNTLGLGLPAASTPTRPASVLVSYPHLGHYVLNLLASIQTSPTPGGAQHPLSVSSSGSDDDSEFDDERGESEQKTPQRKRKNGKNGVAKDDVDRETLVRKIVELLDNEEEEEVKELLKPHMGDLAKVKSLKDLRRVQIADAE